MRWLKNILVGLVVVASIVTANTTLAPTPALAKACSDSSKFFGIPYWYDGLGETKTVEGSGTSCVINLQKIDGTWQTGALRIATNLLGIMLRLIGLVAVGFIIFGGIRYIMSQGNSGDLTTAKTTIVRAVVGLVIAISAVFILNFVAGTVFKTNVNKDNYQVTN